MRYWFDTEFLENEYATFEVTPSKAGTNKVVICLYRKYNGATLDAWMLTEEEARRLWKALDGYESHEATATPDHATLPMEAEGEAT